MDVAGILGTFSTVASFVLFVGIVTWAWSSRRRAEFALAANAPFALPDETAAQPFAREAFPEQQS